MKSVLKLKIWIVQSQLSFRFLLFRIWDVFNLQSQKNIKLRTLAGMMPGPG